MGGKLYTKVVANGRKFKSNSNDIYKFTTSMPLQTWHKVRKCHKMANRYSLFSVYNLFCADRLRLFLLYHQMRLFTVFLCAYSINIPMLECATKNASQSLWTLRRFFFFGCCCTVSGKGENLYMNVPNCTAISIWKNLKGERNSHL